MYIHARRRATWLIAALAAVAVVLAPLVATDGARAAAGYVGVPSGAAWPDGELALMTTGEAYSDSLRSPIELDDRYGALEVSGAPAGIDVTLDLSDFALIHVTGTPTGSGVFSGFTIGVPGTEGAHEEITFSGDIDPGLPSTTTTLTAPATAPYTDLTLMAHVAGDEPTGTVTFQIGGDTIGTATLNPGGWIFSGAVAASYVGTTATLTATYSGDANNAASTSDPQDVYIYGSAAVSGTVSSNGSPVTGEVALLSADGSAVIETTTSDAAGSYLLDVGAVPTKAAASTMYLIRAQLPDSSYIYYSSANGVGTANITDIVDAEATGPTQWVGARDLYFNIPPVWDDIVLAPARQGSSYSDSVSATGTAPMAYAVTAGSLPSGLTLATDGTIGGTPLDQATANFTITASNPYGSVAQSFVLTPGAPGVPPTWDDQTLGAFQVSVEYTDGVVAVGDPTIEYAIVSGLLPAGILLDPATGALTGKPTAADPYSFTIEATNDFGSIDKAFTGTVAAAPEIALELNFAPGTSINDAGSEISASGLKVGSTYTLDMHSTPTRLYTGIVDGTGGFTWVVSLPPNTPVGAHELILTGVAPDGTVMTARAWFSLLPNGTIGAVSYTGPIPVLLSFTGTSVEVGAPLLIALALMLTGGTALLLARRGARSAL